MESVPLAVSANRVEQNPLPRHLRHWQRTITLANATVDERLPYHIVSSAYSPVATDAAGDAQRVDVQHGQDLPREFTYESMSTSENKGVEKTNKQLTRQKADEITPCDRVDGVDGMGNVHGMHPMKQPPNKRLPLSPCFGRAHPRASAPHQTPRTRDEAHQTIAGMRRAPRGRLRGREGRAKPEMPPRRASPCRPPARTHV